MDTDEFKNILLSNDIVFLSKPNCKLCNELIDYLVKNKLNYCKIDVNCIDYGVELVEDIKSKHEIQSFPICFKSAVFIGSKCELIKLIFDSTLNNIENI